MGNELATTQGGEQQGAVEVRKQVNQIQYLMQAVLKDGEHYGVVPGTGRNAKPSLFQAGAEKIAMMFHLVPRYEVLRMELGNGHREYEVHCKLLNRDTGEEVGFGLGTCSTLESKYRYRNQWNNGQKTRYENPDIADTWNTVMKMAKKRAFVDAVKSTTAASDIFTQDVEDMPQFQHQQDATQQQPVEPTYEPPAQPTQPSDSDKAELRELTECWVANGYDRDATAKWMWEKYQVEGIQWCREATANLTPAQRQDVTSIASEDIDF